MTEVSEARPISTIYKNVKAVFEAGNRAAFADMLQLMEISLNILPLTPQNAISSEQITFWYTKIVPLLFDADKEIQAVAISAVSSALPFLLISNHQANIDWFHLREDIMSRYIPEIPLLFAENNSNWHVLWCQLIQLMDTEMRCYPQALVVFLRALEPALQSVNATRRMEFQKCWRVLLDVLGRGDHEVARQSPAADVASDQLIDESTAIAESDKSSTSDQLIDESTAIAESESSTVMQLEEPVLHRKRTRIRKCFAMPNKGNDIVFDSHFRPRCNVVIERLPENTVRGLIEEETQRVNVVDSEANAIETPEPLIQDEIPSSSTSSLPLVDDPKVGILKRATDFQTTGCDADSPTAKKAKIVRFGSPLFEMREFFVEPDAMPFKGFSPLKTLAIGNPASPEPYEKVNSAVDTKDSKSNGNKEATLCSIPDSAILEHIFKRHSIASILEAFERSNRQPDASAVNCLTRMLGSIVSNNENMENNVLRRWLHHHLGALLDSAFSGDESLCPTVLERLIEASEETAIEWLANKINTDHRFSLHMLDQVDAQVFVDYMRAGEQ